MDASSSGKRKSSSLQTSDSDSEESSAKIAAKDYAATRSLNSTIKDHELTVIISGRSRPMKHYHPTTVNNAIRAIIGDYEKIKVMPSGDLAITCKRKTQVQSLLDRDNFTYSSLVIPVKTSLFVSKSYGCRAVITGVPLEVTDDELMKSISEYGVTYLKRPKRKTNQGFVLSLSYLICFKAKTAPEYVEFGYLRLRTKPYNPPPQRCYKCNRYGHTKEKCRGKSCCTKCGSTNHEYSSCQNEKKCVNCHGSHSAAYGGCEVYKQEAKIQIVKESSDLKYEKAKEIVSSQSLAAARTSFTQNSSQLLYNTAAASSSWDVLLEIRA